VRTLFILFLIAAAGLGLGGASAWYTLQSLDERGEIEVGPWSATPFAGDADPYTIARTVAEGSLPLGAAEGLVFHAAADSQGRGLDLDCDYAIEGSTPPARLWTLTAYTPDGQRIAPSPGGGSALLSKEILRFSDGTFRIAVSRWPQPGNWLAVSGDGGLRLTLRVYDTSINPVDEFQAPVMPAIERLECR
jgi:hypothetical protein